MIQTIIMVIAILAVFAIFVGFVYNLVSLIKKGYNDKKKRLTPEEVIQFCDETIDTIIKNNSGGPKKYLCDHLTNFIYNRKENQYSIFELSDNNLHLFIPEFTNENAVKYANGRKATPQTVWWNGNLDKGGYDKENRILFLNWIKSKYVTLKEK